MQFRPKLIYLAVLTCMTNNNFILAILGLLNLGPKTQSHLFGHGHLLLEMLLLSLLLHLKLLHLQVKMFLQCVGDLRQSCLYLLRVVGRT